jgi:hypothetical protein
MSTNRDEQGKTLNVWWLQEGESRGGAVHGTEIGGETDGYRKPQEKDNKSRPKYWCSKEINK